MTVAVPLALFIGLIVTAPMLRRRIIRAARPLALGLPIALVQSLADLHAPWMLYAWLAAISWTAYCAAPLIASIRLPKRPSLIVSIGLAAILIAAGLALQYDLWAALEFGYHDIGLFARALHSSAHGRGFWVDSLGRSLFGEHAAFALALLTPFCRLGVPPFDVLAFASVISLYAPAALIATWTWRRTNSWLAMLLSSIAWLMLPFHSCLIWANGYGFHEVYLAVPFLFAGYLLGESDRFRGASICMLAAMMVREDVALTVAAWGAWVAIGRRRPALGWTTTVVAAGYFATAVLWIIPYFRGAPYPHFSFHYAAGADVTDAQRWLSSSSFVLALLIPLAFQPLRSSAALWLATPSIVETLLVANPELRSLCYHYYTPAIPALFLAVLRGPDRITRSKSDVPSNAQRRRSTRRLTMRLAAAAVAATSAHYYLGVGALGGNPLPPDPSARLADTRIALPAIRAQVPAAATVTASYRVAAHFTYVDRLWTVANDALGDWIIIDDRDDYDRVPPRAALVRAHRAGEYQPIHADGHFVVLRRDAQPSALARQLRPEAPPPRASTQPRELAPGIQLIAIETRCAGTARYGAALVDVTLHWQCTAAIAKDLRFELKHEATGRSWGPYYFAAGAYPTMVWAPGERFCDRIRIELPADRSEGLESLTPAVAP